MAVQESRVLPPKFIEDLAKDYGTQLTALTGQAIDTSKFAPTVAAQDPLQQQAATLASSGIGSFQPFVTAAQTQAADAATQLGTAATGIAGAESLLGTGAGTGAGSVSSYMSPYQTQVIDATLTEYDKQGRVGEQAIKDAAYSSGNFGGGREGAMLGQYQSDRLADRAALQASMLQQGFGQAQNAAQQAFQNQQALFGQQGQISAAQQGLAGAYGNQMNQLFGLSDFGRTGMGQDVSALGSLGALRQGQAQAELTAQQQADQTSAYEPYGRMSQYGNTLTGLLGGVAGSQYQQPGTPSPFQTALGTATGLAGLYGKIFK